MDQERCQELQQNLASEALALLALGCGEERVTKYEQAIQLIGTSCDIPEEATGKLLDVIQQGKENPEKIGSEEITLENKMDVMANWSAQDTFWVVMDLFQVSLGMDSAGERKAMYHMAEELIAIQCLDEWLKENQ